jgi:drug/metabolite transporter (DMT)-like permease
LPDRLAGAGGGAKCLAVAVFATMGHTLIFAAVARASASVVAPMTYVQLLVAAALGWLWFGDPPDASDLRRRRPHHRRRLLLWRAQRVPDLGEAPA